jgi:iron(III) transport system substrate-binding protein
LRRRALLQGALASSLLPPGLTFGASAAGEASVPTPGAAGADPVGVDSLPKLDGELTLYLGRGEGGLYEDIINAIRKRNPGLTLNVRRGPSTALANTLVAEAQVSRVRADLFWSIDASSLGLVARQVAPAKVPEDVRGQLKPGFQYADWVPVSGRIRTIPYNPQRLSAADIPDRVSALAGLDLNFGWAPAYGAFQSFVTAMRLLDGDAATGAWLAAMAPRCTEYAGEFGVVMAVSRGEVDLGFANHYYTLRLKQGKPDAEVALAFTRDDAGCLVNAAGVAILKPSELAVNFVRHLLTREVQSYLAREAFEIPLVAGVPPPAGLPPMAEIQPPRVDLEQLADLQPTLALLRDAGVL